MKSDPIQEATALGYEIKLYCDPALGEESWMWRKLVRCIECGCMNPGEFEVGYTSRLAAAQGALEHHGRCCQKRTTQHEGETETQK